MDCLNVSFLNLHKQIKGVLVHNGILKVQDLMKNFKELDKLKTEPQLQSDQIEALRQELARIKVLSDMLDRENPLEFSLSLSSAQSSVVHGSDHFMNTKRKKIVLMKELQFQQVQQQLINGPNNILQYPPLPLGGIEDLQEDSFLDDVFGIGETTELCGLSQTAKTQIAFQLCMNVQIPKELGGVDGEALYIDTHGDFAVERITEMAKSLRQSVLKKIEKEQQQMPHLVKRYKEEFALDKILAKVRYVRILDEGQQQCLHNQFEDRLQQFPRIRLIIFDTFSEHFRLPELGYGERKRIISQALMGLLEMAQKYQLCIILINNMKLSKKDFLSEVGAGGQPGVPGQPMWSQSKPEPMFGEDLFQCVTNRVFLEKDHNLSEENIIKARLIKGSIASMQTANPTTHFQILEKGIVPII